MKELLAEYKNEVDKELENILCYWKKHTLDEKNGGFIGRIDHNGIAYPEAEKGSVLNSRILWSFSAAYKHTGAKDYATVAERASNYLVNYFLDKKHGGVFWTVDYNGNPLNTKKQFYALSFAIYGLSEYFRATANGRAKEIAILLYRDIMTYSHDPVHGGYIEALSRDWKEAVDIRLSEKDAAERKSMNTHLHILEAFTNLYRIWPEQDLKEKIIDLIQLFLHYIISTDTHHLLLFFDDAWNPKGTVVSYGHDIEAAWLLQEAATVIDDATLLDNVEKQSQKIAEAVTTGLDADGGLWYEFNTEQNHLVKEKHWWPQAEAMVGFFNTWENTGDEKWLHLSHQSWKFAQQFLLDRKNGEWFWGLYQNGLPMTHEDKVGIWKCPYHNSRACIEISRRIRNHIV